jgi:hypothetical protein
VGWGSLGGRGHSGEFMGAWDLSGTGRPISCHSRVARTFTDIDADYDVLLIPPPALQMFHYMGRHSRRVVHTANCHVWDFGW